MEHVSGSNALRIQPTVTRDTAGLPAGAAEGRRHAEVLAEIDAIERGTVSWTTGALTLLVSLVLFLGAGASRWTVTLGLVPVLLFHELGHYVAMRVFHYRDVRMFFIPFFGAAVSGRHYTVAGWKKAVVSLMGPVPGIIAGGAIGLIGPLLGFGWARETALLLLVINGLNLLPLLPLDGGWVVHTLFTSRHHRLDGAFQLLAAGVLAAGGIAFGDPMLGLLAALLLGGASHSYRVARIAHELRAGGLAAASADDPVIPPAVADAIIARLQVAFPKSNARALAQQTLQVFGSINARPPRWGATLVLGAVYVGSLAAALVLAAAVSVGPTQIASRLDRMVSPPWSLDAGGVRGDEQASFRGGSTIVATFRTPAAARDAFVAAAAHPPAGAAAALFGQSVLLAADDPAGRAWSAGAARGAATALSGSAATPIEFTVSCTAPSSPAAESIALAIGGFFLLPPDLRLIPPWASPDPRPAAERAQHAKARRTFLARGWVGADGPPDGAPAPLLAAYLDRPAVAKGPEMGTLPAGGPSASQFARAGDASSQGRTVRVESVRFEDLFHGPAALAAWLRANGCADPRYGFEGAAPRQGPDGAS
jgi:hypothetical protein